MKETLKNNLIIESENLLALQYLLVDYAGKIDVIPIDPPYNTDINYIGYKDSNFENGWNVFMRSRLELAYKLLSKTGVMFINIDENEMFNLKKLCDRIFGAENISILIWKKVNDKFDVNRIEKPLKNIRIAHEYVFVCYKNKEKTTFNNILQPVFCQESFVDMPRPMETVLDNFGTTSSAKDEVAELIGSRDKFSTPKPVRLIKEFIRATSNKNSIILDFFAGSGTTGHASMDLNKEDNGNRKFILVTNNENNICENVTIPRIMNSIKFNCYNETVEIVISLKQKSTIKF
jgi:adenine specific DNA methylase Mod